jgi:hypothetical protein
MRAYQKSEHFASILAVGVTDAAKGRILPFGSNRNDEPLFFSLFLLQIVVSGQNDHLPLIVTA